jgi:hypothetical protein
MLSIAISIMLASAAFQLAFYLISRCMSTLPSAQSLGIFGEKTLHPALKNPPLQKNAMMTLLAFDPNISPNPDHLPLVAATGVLLLQLNYITNLYLHG